MEAKKKMCFVIGPIGAPDSEHRRHADMFLNIVVRPTIEDKYNVARPDEVLSPGSISDRMINDIHEAELAIADFTFHNPNAFYELGLRHSFGKPVIHFVNPPWTIPFDNADYRAIRQDIFTWPGVKKARSELTSYVADIERDIGPVSNPVTRALGTGKLQISGDSKDKLIADMESRLGSLEKTTRQLSGATRFIGRILQGRAEDTNIRGNLPHNNFRSILGISLQEENRRLRPSELLDTDPDTSELMQRDQEVASSDTPGADS